MTVELKVPPLGESVAEAYIAAWRRRDGERIEANETLVELETDKANVEIHAERAGTLKIVRKDGAVKVGEVIARIDDGAAAPAAARPPSESGSKSAASTGGPARPGGHAQAPPPIAAEPVPVSPAPHAVPSEKAPAAALPIPKEPLSPAKRRKLREHGAESAEPAPSGAPVQGAGPSPSAEAKGPSAPAGAAPSAQGEAGVHRTPMSRLRKRIAERMLEAQRSAAILTTFNEVDMAAVIELRARLKERFAEAHKVSLGFISFFARACVLALRDVPVVNSEIRGDDVISRDHVHLGVAVSTERGLVVPIIRHAERRSFAELEREIARLAALAREAKLSPDDLSGGTFTISNGGVFGSLLSTPILNPPQSGILGMHKIEDRPVVKEVSGKKEIVIRPMMYVALSYDHRLVDGRDSVGFLVKVKERIEDPARLMLEA